ncbi:YheC/YheD family protein [Priestia flexa]|uniref:YheC/YheD family endospore coat-associated protein n=1 Tax=Priestia flexa TaxID=86664 RepID=UPI000CB96C7A|nr:YheC/YheD family protein [Priestia flexa]MEC0664463.1 YheC/YheD family protein [Priestia flexa]MED3824664.1 YheC/YheD family protein [Priestia flexa]
MSGLIGFLQYRKDPERAWKAYSFASFTKMEGYEFVYFTPRHINLEDKTINGKMYENGEWVERTTRLPDVIYYEPGNMNKEMYEKVYQLKQLVPFTSNPIGGKANLYRKLKNSKYFAEYIIPYEIVHNTVEILDFMNKHGKTVLKPVWGQQGRNIMFIHQEQGHYVVETNGKQSLYFKDEFIDLMNLTINKENYVIQKYILCKTKEGNCFDFRLHTQKNEHGKWITLAAVPRVAQKGSIVTNMSLGGLTGISFYFLMREYGDEAFNIERLLDRFGISLSQYLEEANGKSYDELGIDIGVDENKKIWIYEVNWKPGEPPFESNNIDIIKNTVKYAIYLAKQNKQTL